MKAVAALLGALALGACGSSSTPGVQGTPAQLRVSSSDLRSAFPARFTCDGPDISPEVGWSGAPLVTRSFAVELTDPDAPGGAFTHWLVWGLPAQATELLTGESTGSLVEGKNDFGTTGYRGPCPPQGATPHHYTVAVYALDATISLPAGSSRQQLEDAMQAHVVGTGTLEATYSR